MGPDELRRQAHLENRHFWYAARRRQVERLLPKPAPPGSRALDLGAGSGGNTPMLARAGFSAVALEHHPVAAAFASSRGLDVVRGDAQQLPFAASCFDVVLACDVLEHLADDHQAVREVLRVLRPGGLLVVTVPADPSLWSRHDVALQHFRRYTRDGLEKTLTDQGLAVSSIAAWMVLLRPVVALRRALARRSQSTATPEGELVSDLEPVSAPINWLLGLVLRLEHSIPALGRCSRGVSLIAVATRAES